MDGWINVGLLRNPLNWVTVFLMVLIGLFAVDSMVRLFRGAHGDPAPDAP